ncbi:hypothetical protein [Bradyrhizobium sp. SZCCHNR1098]|uniref:hypothetical protein n=1 Tax=Bradyrhizobium sp. SZCCHNR1098 TaxID=3057370 RepID=UPI002916A10C|nr:hypothetical protein [Bradyrhizobium sp. SZCCHNR1098]
MTDCASCRTALNEVNTPSNYSVALGRARTRGFNKPLCLDCLIKLDQSEMPDAVTVAEELIDEVCGSVADRYSRGISRKTLEDAVRLLADQFKRDPQSAMKEADAIDALLDDEEDEDE